jgi:hypothetical protein
MANNILAVQLGAESLSLAIAQASLRSSRIQLLASLERGSPAIADLVTSRTWDCVIAALPAESAAFRVLDFPFHDRRRLGQAVGPALEAHVPFSLDESLVGWDYLDGDRHGSVLAAMVARETLGFHRDGLASLNIKAQRWVWQPCAALEIYRRAAASGSFTAIDLGADGAVVACFVDGKLTGLRTSARADDATTVRNVGWFVRTLDPSGARALVGGARADALLPALREAVPGLTLETLPERCPFEIAETAAPAWRSSTTVAGLALAAAGDVHGPVVEIAENAGAAGASVLASEPVRRLAPWAAVTAAFLLTAVGLEHARLSRQQERLEAVARRIYASVLPEGGAGAGQKMKMEARASELERRLQETGAGGSSVSPLAVLADMSALLPADIEVEFDVYAYDPPSVRLRGRSDSFEAVTRLQETLRASGRFASVEVGDVRAAVNDGVEFELALRLGAGSPA